MPTTPHRHLLAHRASTGCRFLVFIALIASGFAEIKWTPLSMSADAPEGLLDDENVPIGFFVATKA